MSGRGPTPAYLATTSPSPLVANTELYSAIHKAPKKLLSSHILPIRQGYAWTLKAGQVCRITTPEGPQVGDLNIWNAHNSKERFWASRTRQLQSSHVKLYDRLWSCLPWLRPLVTVTGDTVSARFGDEHGQDEDGGRVHDLLGTRCDPYVNKMLSGEEFNYHCHSNLVRAIRSFGLVEADVHDVLNVFQVTGLNKDGKYYMKTSPAQPGDYFEFFAEIDVICALSTCPGGDLSKFGWGGDAGQAVTLECCRPLGIEVYEIEDMSGLSWRPPELVDYQGGHGLSAGGD